MKHPIIVGTDLTEASDDALIQAEARATRDDARLTVLHTIDVGFVATLATDLLNGGAYAERPLGQHSLLVEARQATRAAR